MTPIEQILVVIPARDEEELLPRCLTALAQAVGELRDRDPRIQVRSVVVADMTTDDTGAIVGRSEGTELISVDFGNVGAARAAGVDHLLDPLDTGQVVWIATSDADSVVPPNWLTAQRQIAEAGADVFVGSVAPDRDGLTPDQFRAWTAFHQTPDPSGDIHGANLGIRVSAYRAIGGFRHMPVGEDVDLVHRAISSGLAVTRGDFPLVITSSRSQARAPAGYASWLHQGGLSRTRQPDDRQ